MTRLTDEQLDELERSVLPVWRHSDGSVTKPPYSDEWLALLAEVRAARELVAALRDAKDKPESTVCLVVYEWNHGRLPDESWSPEAKRLHAALAASEPKEG